MKRPGKKVDDIYQREFLKLSEVEVIETLLSFKNEEGASELREIWSAVTAPFDLHDTLDLDGLYYAKSVQRKDLGFDPAQKPGDFDLVLIPFKKDKILFECTAACEFKIIRPTTAKPSKNADSLGVSQAMGLVRDGFPQVSIFHISLSEPLADNMKKTIMHSQLKTGDKIPETKSLSDFLVEVKYDHFQSFSADKQMKRLISTELPKYIGIHCFGLSKNGERYRIEYPSKYLINHSTGYFNPNAKKETIDKIRIHFYNSPSDYTKILK